MYLYYRFIRSIIILQSFERQHSYILQNCLILQTHIQILKSIHVLHKDEAFWTHKFRERKWKSHTWVSSPFSRLALGGQSLYAYRHVENNRTTSTIGMHITNQLRRNNYGSKQEPHKYNLRPYASSIAGSYNANAIKQLVSRFLLGIATE